MNKYKHQLCKPYLKRDFGNLAKLGYVFENKLDGERAFAYIKNGVVELVSRKGHFITDTFSEITEQLKSFPTCILDGEICVLTDGIADFNKLARRSHLKAPTDQILWDYPATFIIFDILELNSNPIWLKPFKERREILENVFIGAEGMYNATNDKWAKFRYLQIIEQYADGNILWDNRICREGMVAKHLKEPYHAGQRISAWLKIKKTKEIQLFAMRFEPTDHEECLICDQDVRVAVPNIVDRAILKDLLYGGAVPIVEIEYLERTPEGKLRFPVFKGIKEENGVIKCKELQKKS